MKKPCSLLSGMDKSQLVTFYHSWSSTRVVQGQVADTVELEKIRQKPPVRQDRGGVLVGGVGDVLVRFGQCCHPLPGERILGVITRGKE